MTRSSTNWNTEDAPRTGKTTPRSDTTPLGGGAAHSPEVERAVLGTIINNPEFFDEIDHFHTDLFHVPANRVIAEAIRDMSAGGIAFDLISLHQYVNQRGKLDQAGGAMYLAGLVEQSNGAYLEHYINVLREQRDLRRHEHFAHRVLRAVQGRDTDELYTVMSEAPTQGESEVQVRTATEVNSELMDDFEALMRNEPSRARPTGLGGIDNMLIEAGILPQQLIVIGARPSIGKSVLMQNIARSVARSGKIVSVHSLEMSAKDLQMRALTAEIGVNPRLAIKANGEQAIRAIQEAMRMTEDLILYDDRPEQSIEDIEARARQLKRKHGELGAIAIDYLQLMRRPKGNTSNDQINEITRRLKTLARRMDCPVILLSQLSREVEKRPDKRPIMADLRESGGIEQDADIILLLYREHYYNPKADPHLAEANMVKQRGGPTGIIKLQFNGPNFTFS